ncbi:Putative transcriptional regulator YwtF [[Clostridium] hylemonae DSM 15053]|nr:Putative transcriptional regulator YwtF [[Clostridium] hylemonae DSM 15053]
MDQENNGKMIEDVQKVIGRDMKLEEYDTLQEEAEALLKGRIDAAIYNEAFAGILDDAIEDYSSEIRILYQYGIDTPVEADEADIETPFNIYISGIDVSGPITTNSRSDVNIIMTVNPSTKKILLTTTPRDYYVPIPDISGEQRDKLTHAGIYGVDVSMNTLERIYGIDISYYARVNFTSLITIVDALGV